jgi:hypothetical protein
MNYRDRCFFCSTRAIGIISTRTNILDGIVEEDYITGILKAK